MRISVLLGASVALAGCVSRSVQQCSMPYSLVKIEMTVMDERAEERWRKPYTKLDFIDRMKAADPVAGTPEEYDGVDGYVMDRAMNVVRIECVDSAGQVLEFLVAEPGSVLAGLREQGGTYNGNALRVRVTDASATASVSATLRSVDAETGLVKGSREVDLSASGADTFVSSEIILYDSIDPETRTYLEGLGYVVMPASLFEIFLRGARLVICVTELHLEMEDGALVSLAEYLPGYRGQRPVLSKGTTWADARYVGQRMKLVLPWIGTAFGVEEVTFRITWTTHYKGFCMNATDPRVEAERRDDRRRLVEVAVRSLRRRCRGRRGAGGPPRRQMGRLVRAGSGAARHQGVRAELHRATQDGR